MHANPMIVSSPYSKETFHVVNLQNFINALQKEVWPNNDLSLYPSASRVPHADSLEAVRTNEIQIAEVFMSRLNELHPIFTADSIPFLATNYEDAAALWASQKNLVNEVLADHGVMALYAVPWPAQNFYSNIELSAGEKFSGKKLRSYSATISSMATLLGAEPVLVEAKDLDAALAAKQVDIVVTSPSTGVSARLWKHTTKYTKVGGWIPKNIVLINKRLFDDLESDQQQKLLEIAQEYEQRGWTLSKKETAEKESILQEMGMTVLEPTEALLADLNDAGATMFDDWRKSSRSWLQKNLPVKNDGDN
ncbi:hypothetical protein GCM10007939_24050 [Amylibacter marinus]|uniref:TRAP-type C4-dicarboxylate transport system, substrate-binding protein n=1 Tax=Amylibacter marinus TaxID=1475483 RepID=A0ABQ5VXG4_9RHOB|nr:hypothetical protein GCM10007939_24050 [Amylibacter marinus]